MGLCADAYNYIVVLLAIISRIYPAGKKYVGIT